jgi:branched-chain amino acid transport system substrate-binding protein
MFAHRLALLVLAAACFPAAAQELRIGFLNTTSGNIAIVGQHMENGWKLGLAAEGWSKDGDRLGDVPTRIFYADDQGKTDIGVREVERMIRNDRVQIVAGVLAGNVVMAVHKPVFDANLTLLATNAGPAPLAGPLCNPLFVSASFMGDQNAEATGELATRDGIKSTALMAPNYQAGKDMVAGFKRTYQGRIAGEILFKFGETDYQADLSKVRAMAPEAVFVFAPGGMGVSFLKQWASSGLRESVNLYTLYVVDNATLPAIGEAAIGSVHTGHWNPDFDHPRNREFIRAYLAKYNQPPSMFAAQGYDGARAIAAAVRSLGGKVDDAPAFARTIRKSGLASVRGDLKYNVNGFPIQPYWKIEVVAGPDGKPIKRGREMVFKRPDSLWEKCPSDKRS